MSTARRGASLMVALLVAATLAITAPPTVPAGAQASGTLALMAQSPFVPSEGTFRAIVRWSGEFDPDLTLGGLIYNPIADESQITEPPTSPFFALPYTAISGLDRTPEGHLVLDIPIRSVEGGPDRIRLREAGVYPVQIELRDADGVTTLGALRTNLIRLPTEAAEIDVLPISTVLEVSSAEGLTLAPATDLLTSHPDLPLTVIIGDGVLTQLENDNELADRFRLALNGRSVVIAPTPALDISALAAIGRPDLYAAARATTFERLQRLDIEPTLDVTIVGGNLTTPGIDLLVRLGISVILETGSSQRSTGVLEGTNGSIRVVEVDATLTSSMANESRSVERVHRLLAALSMRAATDRSPIFVGGSALRSVPLTSIQLFLTALEQPGTLGTVSLVEAASASPLFPIRPDEQPTQNLLAIEDLIRAASSDIATYETFYVNGGLPPAVFQRSLVEALVIDRNPADRARALQQLATNLDDRFDDIVLPEGQSVTLAAQRADIPLTVENNSGGARTVMLLFDSDKINVTQDQAIVVLEEGVSTVDIELEARSLGRSPLRIRIMTPDRTVQLSETTFGVRSTAVPGLGLLLSATALLFLMLWWVRSITKSRAARKHPASAQPPVAAEAKLSS